MNNAQPRPVIETPFQLDIGYAAQFLARLTIERPDLEVRIRAGQLRVGFRGQDWEECPVRAGCEYAEPTIDEWLRAATMSASIPMER